MSSRKNPSDLIIPRGGESLIRFVVRTRVFRSSSITKGLPHLCRSTADFDKAEQIIVTARPTPGVCNGWRRS